MSDHIASSVKNLVFDMGNVVMKFVPPVFIQREGITDPSQAEILLTEIFRSKEWPMLDSGDLDEPEMAEIVVPRLPQSLQETGRHLILHWADDPIPVPGMAELIRDCKAAGYHIYLLSNASRAQHDYWPRVPGNEYFEGTIISADERCVKPDSQIYRILLDRFHLTAGESIFFDDSAANVAAAETAGMYGYLFEGDTEALRSFILG